MKHYTYILCATVLALSACRKEPAATNEPLLPPTPVQEMPDSTLWGRLGEDTGMSTLQFITDKGDTLELFRTNQYTGEDGKLIGEIRNTTDRFAITVTADGETVMTAINTTQLEEIWKSADTNPYDGWKLWNGHILLSGIQQQEIGAVCRIDTMDIMTLDRDSLVIRNHVGQIITLKEKV